MKETKKRIEEEGLTTSELKLIVAHREDEKVQQKQVKVKPKKSFSEKLVISVLFCNFAILLMAMLFSFQNPSADIWKEILQIPLVLTPSSVGFFIWKAKSENVIKIENNPDYDLEQMLNESINLLTEETEIVLQEEDYEQLEEEQSPFYSAITTEEADVPFDKYSDYEVGDNGSL